jgi:hypothetical protein
MSNGDPIDNSERRAKIVSAYGGLLLPVALLLATAWFNHSNATIAARQKCIDQSLQIVSSAYGQQNQSPTREEERQQMLATLGDLMVQSCSSADLSVPPLVSATLRREGQAAQGTAAGNALASVATRAEHQSGDDEAAVAPTTTTTTVAAPSTGIRLFLHISEESQRAPVRQLGQLLDGTDFQGRRISVQGIELVPERGDNSLRCLKQQDCRQAAALAALINSRLTGTTLTPLDLSQRFQNATNVSGGTFEVWFRAGEIVPRGT